LPRVERTELPEHAADRRQSRSRVLSALVRAEVLLIALVGFGNLAVAVAGRVSFPWPLEWLEGLTLAHALRLLDAKPLYAPPAADFVASIYPPLAYLPVALSVQALGPSLAAARIPSILATLLTLLLIARATSHSGEGRLAGVLAAGLFALGYGYGGQFYDLARVDPFFVLCVVAGVERLAADRPRAALALFALSCLAKQQGLPFLVVASLWLAWRDRSRHLASITCAWGGVLALLALLHWVTDGWFTTYCFAIPAAHGVIWASLLAFLIDDLLLRIPLLTIAAVASLFRSFRAPRAIDVSLAAALAVSALGRVHPGGFDNVLIPGFALLVIVGTSALAPILFGTESRPLVRSGAALALLAQALLLFRPATAYWPQARTDEAYRSLVAALERCAAGRTAVALDHTGLLGTPFLHSMPLADLWKTRDRLLVSAGTEALERGLSGPAAPGAIAVGWHFPELEGLLSRDYHVCDRLPFPPATTGYQPALVTIYSRVASRPR